MFPEASIVYGIDLGQLDFDDIYNLEPELDKHKTVQISNYGEEDGDHYSMLTIKGKFPSVVCEAEAFDPLKLIIKPNWDTELQNALTDINTILETPVKNKPKWFLIELYGG